MSEPMSPLRVLWVGDAVAQTGFARVTHNVCQHLVDQGWEVAVLGINYKGDPHNYPYPIFPAVLGGDVWGMGRIADLCKKLQPHVIIINNDPWNIAPYLEVLREEKINIPVVAYMPVDGANQAAARSLNGLAYAITYTQYGKKELAYGGYTGRCAVIPHGVNERLYRPIPAQEAREKLGLTKSLPPNAFVVGNVNRNQPRKRLDLTIQYFAQWWIQAGQPKEAFLYLHTSPRDIGWNVLQLATYYGINKRTIITNPNMTPESSIQEDMMPYVYAAQDVHVTTTQGEGWGLTQHESMACERAQIAPAYSALGEWMEGAAILVPCSTFAVTPNQINVIGGIVDGEPFIQAIQRFYEDPALRDHYGRLALARATEPRFMWENVAAQFDTILREAVDERRPRPVGLQEVAR